MNTASAKGVVEFAERMRRVAYNNPVYYGIERSAGRSCPHSEAVDKKTRERCRHFYLAVPISVRATFLRLPFGDSLTLEFLDEAMLLCDPVPALARRIADVAFAGAAYDAVEHNQPWMYWLPLGRGEEEAKSA